MYLFGYNRLSLRLAIVLLAFLNATWLFSFFKRNFNQTAIGFLSALALITFSGMHKEHLLRSGDQDVAVAFFLFASIIAYWKFLNTSGHQSSSWIIAFFLFTGMAVLTKSVVGLMFLPGVALFSIRPFLIRKTLSKKAFYVGLLLFFMLISSFYLYMELQHPGFLQLVWQNEIGGRYAEVIDAHSGPWFFYIENLNEMLPWIIALPFAIYFSFRAKNLKIRSLLSLASLCWLSYFVIISSASTKLIWYLAPLYPLTALLFGATLIELKERYQQAGRMKYWKRIQLISALVLLVMLVLIGVRHSQVRTSYYYEEYTLKMERLFKEHPEYQAYKVHTHKGWYPNIIFKVNQLNKLHGMQVEIAEASDSLHVQDLVFGAYHERLDSFERETLVSYGRIKLFRLKSRRN